MKKIIIAIILLHVNCSSPKYFDKIEYLKDCLIKYGFHRDTTFNLYKEYSWKVKTGINDTMLIRETQFYLLDTIFQNRTFSFPKIYLNLRIQEYQYIPEKKKKYADIYFPTIYDEEAKKAQFFEHYYNLSKGLRHVFTPGSTVLNQKITLENRYVLLSLCLERDKDLDTTKLRDFLKTIESGIVQASNKYSQMYYLQIREYDFVQNNLRAGKAVKSLNDAGDIDVPPEQEESELLNNLQQSMREKVAHCHCIDVCATEDGCIKGGYIYFNVVTASALPADSAECILIASDGNRFFNRTNKYGSVGWCRVPKTNYTADVHYKNRKFIFVPIWDSLPRSTQYKLD